MPGLYTFVLGHDGGACLSIGRQRVLGFNGLTSFRTTTRVVDFRDAGVYPIRIEMFDHREDANLVFWFIPPGDTTPQLVPTALLFADPLGVGNALISRGEEANAALQETLEDFLRNKTIY